MIKLLFSERFFFNKIILLFLLLIFGSILQEEAPVLFKHFFLIIIIIILFLNLIFGKKELNIKIVLLYFMIFSLYPRKLYDTGFYFVNYFSGYYKIIIIILFLLSLKIKKKNKERAIIVLFFLQLFAGIIGGVFFFNYDYLMNDLMAVFITYSPFVIIISNLIVSKKEFNSILNFFNAYSISFVLYSFYLILLKGIEKDDNGFLFVTFGPINLLILLLLLFYSLKEKGVKKYVSILALLMYLPIKFLSINSQEILMILIIFTVYYFINKKIIFKIFNILVFIIVLNLINTFSYVDTGNHWINLKVNQMISLFRMDVELNNSTYIRFLEYELVEKQVLYTEKLYLGKGLGATLKNTKGLLNKAVLHEATFPKKELIKGEIHTLHESLYKYVLRYGFLGLLIVFFVYKSLYRYKNKLKSKSDKILFLSLLILSLYFYGWSYRFLFIVNFFIAFIIIGIKNINNEKHSCS